MKEHEVDDAGSGPARPPTMADIAARVGVSKQAVSLVFRNAPGLSEQTRARVLEVAAELGYRANRSASLLARRRTRLLGVTMSVRSPFHAELVEHIHAAADDLGYEVVLGALTPTHDERRAVETLLEFRCEALLLLGTDAPLAGLTALGEQLPVVVVGRRAASATLDVVRTADGKGVGQVVDHLVSLGHRDIVHIDGGRGAIATDRRNGYRRAMRRHGLDEQVRIVSGDHTEEAGARAARLLLDEKRLPTALVAANDRCALGALDVFAREGVAVPGTVSVAGYDDSPLARLAHVDLTTVSQEAQEQARHAVAAAVDRLDGGRTEPRQVVLPPRLITRSTTAPPA
ncbi:LacI family DNA-binding transcriptional regulator [Streptomyces violens]|uniref:LacI family DNA-binding transcriptional regulator n=1 Tax=Streptomyces violens TaxID=66377 RepID=UPI0004C02B1E|nr:LacI family DNA-binding transcriptional regulator [Streptomyces violens]